MEWILYLLAALMIAAGVLGTVMPGLPGVPLVFAGMLLAAAVESFAIVSVKVILLLAGLTALSVVAEYVATALGARRAGASAWAVVGAALGALLGILAGPLGVLFGPLVGAVLGELAVRRDFRQAGRAGVAAWVGFLVGTVTKAALVVAMLAVFTIAVLAE
jgi:uncharacterized protein YqgC (DUF456 family)